MNAQEQMILNQMKERISSRFALHQLILFGSRARNEAEPDSDMDVLVVLDEEVGEAATDYISDCAWEAGFEFGIVVVPIAVSKAEWEEGPMSSSLLAMAVAREGIAI